MRKIIQEYSMTAKYWSSCICLDKDGDLRGSIDTPYGKADVASIKPAPEFPVSRGWTWIEFIYDGTVYFREWKGIFTRLGLVRKANAFVREIVGEDKKIGRRR